MLVMEFCVEVGLTPKQLHAAVRRMTMKERAGGREGEVEEEEGEKGGKGGKGGKKTKKQKEKELVE